jgi:DNA mismatch endonuclease (patch repair protein)
MPDVLTPEQRSYNMSRIRSKNTSPEMFVRRLVHGMGFRYRLHSKHLPGRPDLVFASKRRVIFVHGCYWHMHDCRWGRVMPATNAVFWREKRKANVERDRKNMERLTADGWKVLVVWECSVRDTPSVRNTIRRFLRRPEG